MTTRNWAFLALVGFVAACSSGSGGGGKKNGSLGGSNPSGGANLCATACQKINECDVSENVSECTTECASGMETSKLRADYLSRVSSCFVAKDCASVLNGSAEYSCVDEAVASLAPTATASAFCTGFSNAALGCDATVDIAECLGSAKIYNDVALQGAQTCFAQACSQVQGCVDAQLGIESSPPVGEDSCQFAYDGMCDEPVLCDYGTDTYDCSSGDNSCQYAFDGMCDEPEYCAYGTDAFDCN